METYSDLESKLSKKIDDLYQVKDSSCCGNLCTYATICLIALSILAAGVIIASMHHLMLYKPVIRCKYAISHYNTDVAIICVAFLFLILLALAFLLLNYKTRCECNKRIIKQQEAYLTLYCDVMKKEIAECAKGDEKETIKKLNEQIEEKDKQIKDLQKASEIGFETTPG